MLTLRLSHSTCHLHVMPTRSSAKSPAPIQANSEPNVIISYVPCILFSSPRRHTDHRRGLPRGPGPSDRQGRLGSHPPSVSCHPRLGRPLLGSSSIRRCV